MYTSLLSTVLAFSLIGCGDAEKAESTESKAVQVNGETVATVNGTPIGSRGLCDAGCP